MKILLALTAAAAFVAAPAPTVGPPWISIEYPPSPYDRTTREALLLVHSFHHGTPANLPVSGTAEGMVKGQRRSVALEFDATSRPGVYALKRQWGTEGSWVLSIAVSQGPGDVAGALVELDSRGSVATVRVPTVRRDGWDFPRAIAATDIEAALASRVALASAGTQK
jgi:hypothetical protein